MMCIRRRVALVVVLATTRLCRDQFGNAYQVIGDQVEHEVGGNAANATMFGPAHRAVLLAPAEDAFDHRPARLRHAIAMMARGPCVDSAPAVNRRRGHVAGRMSSNVLMDEK